jgi:hypothetical protein
VPHLLIDNHQPTKAEEAGTEPKISQTLESPWESGPRIFSFSSDKRGFNAGQQEIILCFEMPLNAQERNHAWVQHDEDENHNAADGLWRPDTTCFTTEEGLAYHFGDFGFVRSYRSRLALRCMFKIVEAQTKAGRPSWQLLKDFSLTTTRFTSGPYSEFHDDDQCTDWCSHSGSTYAWTLATLAEIAQRGWFAFVRDFCLQQARDIDVARE